MSLFWIPVGLFVLALIVPGIVIFNTWRNKHRRSQKPSTKSHSKTWRIPSNWKRNATTIGITCVIAFLVLYTLWGNISAILGPLRISWETLLLIIGVIVVAGAAFQLRKSGHQAVGLALTVVALLGVLGIGNRLYHNVGDPLSTPAVAAVVERFSPDEKVCPPGRMEEVRLGVAYTFSRGCTITFYAGEETQKDLGIVVGGGTSKSTWDFMLMALNEDGEPTVLFSVWDEFLNFDENYTSREYAVQRMRATTAVTRDDVYIVAYPSESDPATYATMAARKLQKSPN